MMIQVFLIIVNVMLTEQNNSSNELAVSIIQLNEHRNANNNRSLDFHTSFDATNKFNHPTVSGIFATSLYNNSTVPNTTSGNRRSTSGKVSLEIILYYVKLIFVIFLTFLCDCS